ncbi:MAG: polysaccharide deacetylase family protein [Verrucomicrobiales bacterium]|jgi:peptidoglycan/xylan/chitin deacetylase (PgdA/CDA1 family)
MNTFTSERSYLPLLRKLLPRTNSETSADTMQPAAVPGQNAVEVYGMAVFVFVFHVCWIGDWLGTVWFALPAGLVLLHLTALASGVLGDQLQKRYPPKGSQAYIWPQRFHWGILTTMAWTAIAKSFPVTTWLAWAFLILLVANLCFASRLFILALMHLIVGWVWYQFGWKIGFPMLFTLHGAMLYAALYPHSQIFGPLVRHFETKAKEVWVTIDDGPCQDTVAILELLDTHRAKATFFLIGERAEERPDEVTAIVEGGHQIANHTYSHPTRTFWMALSGAIDRQVSRTQETLERLTGSRPRLFRSPVGFKSPMLHAVLAHRDLQLVGWSARGFDGVGSDVEKALARLQRDIRPGTIILVHQGRDMNLPLLSGLLDWLAAEGFRCVVPNLFEKDAARLS